MVAVNTMEDIIEALDADPLLLDALRARLLTRDLIELPQVVAELAASQLRLEATLHQFMESANARLGGLETRTAGLEENQRELMENQRETNARLGGLETRTASLEENQRETNARLGGLETTVAAMRLDLDSMKGDHMELRLQSKVHSMLAERMGLRRVQILRALYPAGSLQKFLDDVHDAEDEGRITTRLYMRIIDTDLIVSARRRGGGETVYIALEVANKLDREDIDRAAMSREALALAFPEVEIIAAVYGREISDGDREYAESKGVAALLDASRR